MQHLIILLSSEIIQYIIKHVTQYISHLKNIEFYIINVITQSTDNYLAIHCLQPLLNINTANRLGKPPG